MAYYGRLSVWYLFFIACTPKPTYTQLPSWEKLERESNKKSTNNLSLKLQKCTLRWRERLNFANSLSSSLMYSHGILWQTTLGSLLYDLVVMGF